MNPRNLEQPATAFWISAGTIPPSGAVWGGEKKTFGSLRNATVFVMTKLSDADRALAWIAVDGADALKIEEIEEIYRRGDVVRG